MHNLSQKYGIYQKKTQTKGDPLAKWFSYFILKVSRPIPQGELVVNKVKQYLCP